MGMRRRRRARKPVLKRRYGLFECERCSNKWESSRVYVNYYGYYQEDEEAAYGQKCKRCKWINDPYCIEPLRCAYCDAEDCICHEDERALRRHINKRIPHKSDLCMKCLNGIPCNDDDDDDDDYDYDYYCPC